MRRYRTLRVIPVAAAAVVCLAGAGLAPDAAAQELGFVYAAAYDQTTGQPVTDLTAEEFEVAEDDNPAKVVSARIGTEPMKIALLVDNGRRVARFQAMSHLKAGVAAFIENIPAEHEISLVTIGGSIVRRTDFTTDRAELLREAEAILASSESLRFVDGVRETWDRRYQGDEAWPIFVAILTDANEISAFMNERRYTQFIDSLRAGNVVVHSVVWSSRNLASDRAPLSDVGGGGNMNAVGVAQNLAANTGGRFNELGTPNVLADTLRQLARDMTTHYRQASIRYRVLYEPPDPRGRSMSVSVTRDNVNLQLWVNRAMP